MRGGARTATVALTIAAVLLTAASVLGQGGTGVVAGRVIFDDTGEPMFGVEVKIEGTNFTTTTDRTGRYRLAPVPVGEQTVVVLAQGYTTQTTKVTVVAGEPVTVDARLSIAFAEAVEVTAPLLQGQARALTVQKNAANIVNVVSADDITALPDTNVAEAAGRIPGVSLTIDDGEGENMVVRGLPPQLNSVSINGERIPSTDTRNRNIDFVNTSSQILQSIEVTKAITPNMDADAIGGVVNLVTKQAPEEPILLVGFGGEYLDQSEAVNSEANFTWGQRFSGGANGFVLSGSYEDHDRTNQTRGDMEFDGDDLTQFILRGEESQAKRYSINGAFDHLSTDYTLFVRGTWSGREQTKIRRRERLRDVQRGIDGGKSGRIQWDIRDRERTVETGSFSLGGTNVLSDQWSTNWSASYNVGRREEPNTIQTIYRQSSATYTTPEFTGYDLYIFPTNLDYTKASLNQIQLLPISSKDEDITGRLDFKKALGTGGALEFGVKYRTKEKTNDEDTINYTGSGVPKYNAVIEPTVYHIYDDEYGVLGQFPNSRLGFDLIEQYGLTGRKDYTVDSADYTANEDVSAAYAQVEFTLAKNLMMLFGARYEYTASDYVGKEIIFNEDGDYQETLPITGDDSYSNVLPSLHLRWSLSDRTNLRLAATSSLARPVFYDIIPYQVIDQENDEVSRGNPDLDVTTATNFDLLFEHYFTGVGVFSAGVFYKDIKDPIVSIQFEEEIDGETWQVEQPANGQNATIKGFEVAYSNQFRSWPSPWDGFGVMVNYTYADGDTTLGDGRQTRFFLQPEQTANFSISYEKGGFSGRIAWKFVGDFIEEYGDSDEQDIYIDDHQQWDLSITQALGNHLSLYLNLVNMNDEPWRRFYGGPFRPFWYETYSWWGSLGLRYNLY